MDASTSTTAADSTAPAATNRPATDSASAKPKGDSQPGQAGKINAQSNMTQSNTAAIGAPSPMDSSANATQKTPDAKQQAASTNTDQTKVASATPRSNSRAQSQTGGAKLNPADTAYRAELRNCVQQSGVQRESCLDQAIENHGRSQSG